MTLEETLSTHGVPTSAPVLVAGATGGVGQLAVGQLLAKGLPVRVLVRSRAKAQRMFGDGVDIAVGYIRYPATLTAAVQDVTHILCCTGTTAFPSARWEFDRSRPSQEFLGLLTIVNRLLAPQANATNSPAQVDAEGVKNLVAAVPHTLQRFVLISSCGILRKTRFPFNLLNAFGVLDAKQQGETAVIQSGLPYTILRPGQLIDGPFTSYDINTLLQAKTQRALGVVVGTGDRLTGQMSRVDLAAACVECLFYSEMSGQVFELISEGLRPSKLDWATLFSQIHRQFPS